MLRRKASGFKSRDGHQHASTTRHAARTDGLVDAVTSSTTTDTAPFKARLDTTLTWWNR